MVDFRLTPALERLAEHAREVGTKAAAGRTHKEQSWITGFDREFSEELGRLGWLGMTWPVELGGGGRSPLERFLVTEALIAAGAPIAATWVGDRQIGPTLVAYGNDEQKRRYLPSMIAGTVTWCIGMSEPDAGSDLAALRTRAIADGERFVIEGRKIWTSFAADAEHCYLIARTGSERAGHSGISEFIVDMESSGVHVSRIVDSTGEAHFCEVEFDGVRVPRANLVGTLDNSWSQLMRQLEHERAGIDRLMSNWELLQETKAMADTSDPLIRDELARLECGYRIGRLLVIREVLGQAPRSFSAATKAFCTEHEQRVAQFIGRVAGADTMMANRVARSVIYAPAYTIQGGTSTILRNVIAERVLGLPKG
jgi:alkylation response protein AidB-like acyl-CoA dehydrogenase